MTPLLASSPEPDRRSPSPLSEPCQNFDIYASLPITGDPPAIRLLDLEAPSRSRNGSNVDAPLAGRLRVVRLQDSPLFTALSYVWGQGVGPSEQISCNGALLDITANCHAALRQIRQHYGAVTIWVDSVCINQNDGAEIVS